MQDTLQDIPEFQKQIGSEIEKVLGQTLDVEQALQIYERRKEIDEFKSLLSETGTYKHFQIMCRFTEKETDMRAAPAVLCTFLFLGAGLLSIGGPVSPAIAVEEQYYAISPERKLKHPSVLKIIEHARSELLLGG